MSEFVVRQMTVEDVREVANLQALAFPPPFPAELLWNEDHLSRHVELFPEGQFVAATPDIIVASCSNTLISDARWHAHEPWDVTVGGPYLHTFDEDGSTLYGLDITVHPNYRRRGVARRLYDARKALVRQMGLARYGTGCRMPGFQEHLSENPGTTPDKYAKAVAEGLAEDRTLTPLLRMRMDFIGVINGYMEDWESGDAAALLEWRP